MKIVLDVLESLEGDVEEFGTTSWRESYMNRAVSIIVAIVLLFLAGRGVWVVWNRLDHAGYVPHDEMTIVYSPDWQNGEYKTCSTLNGNGYRAPGHSTRPQNILCDGGVPSGRLEDGKVFDIRFWGETYVKGRPPEAVLLWTCGRNGGDPAITCKRAK